MVYSRVIWELENVSHQKDAKVFIASESWDPATRVRWLLAEYFGLLWAFFLTLSDHGREDRQSFESATVKAEFWGWDFGLKVHDKDVRRAYNLTGWRENKPRLATYNIANHTIALLKDQNVWLCGLNLERRSSNFPKRYARLRHELILS